MEPSASYGQYCPLSRALDVLGERWSLMIVRDLYIGTTRFNDLARGLPGISRSLLAKRLRSLERTGVIDHLNGEYRLSPAGRELEPVLFSLGGWGAKWSFGEPVPEELDADLLIWWMHDRLDTSTWPGDRHVLQVVFSDDPRHYWIVVEHGDASVCRTDPGFDVSVILSCDVSTLYQLWMGRIELRGALRSGRLTASGHRALVRELPNVLQLSQMSGLIRAAPSP